MDLLNQDLLNCDLAIGDIVIRNNKYDPSKEISNEIYIVASEPWKCGEKYLVKLEGQRGGFAVDGLTKIDTTDND